MRELCRDVLLLPQSAEESFHALEIGEVGTLRPTRVTITVAAAFVIVHSVRSRQYAWLALAIPVGLLFAPAVFVALPATVWKVLDVVTAALLLLTGLLIPNPSTLTEDGQKRWEWWKVALLVFAIGWVLLGIGVYGTGSGCESVSYGRIGPYCD